MAKKTTKRASGGATGRATKPPALRLEFVRAGELKDNPRNWRTHPASQVGAFKALHGQVGFIGYCLLNERTGHLVDGHMRKSAVGPETLVPVLVGSWSERQERQILATHDPIAQMAELDPAAARKLLDSVDAQLPAIQALLEVLESRVERALPKEQTKAPGADDDEGEGDGGGDGETKAKAITRQHGVMVRCRDELEQVTLTEQLKLEGYTVKRVANV